MAVFTLLLSNYAQVMVKQNKMIKHLKTIDLLLEVTNAF